MVSSARSSLLGLPIELQRGILTYLADSPGAIQSVIRTSKHLYELGLPFSVHTFSNAGSSQDDHAQARHRERTRRFLRYIAIEKPQLAAHVHTILLGGLVGRDRTLLDFDGPGLGFHGGLGPNGGSSEGPEGPSRIAPNDRTVYRQLIDDFHPGGNEVSSASWLEDLEYDVEEPEVCLLLLVCWNIKELAIGEPEASRILPGFMKRCVTEQKRTFDGHPFPLSRLREFYTEGKNRNLGYERYDILGALAFQLPKVSHYECVLPASSSDNQEGFEALPRGSSNVQHINLRASSVSKHAFSAMIGAARELKSLEVIYNICDLMSEAASPLVIMRAILPYAHTLESLHLNLELGHWIGEQKTLFGIALREMKALKRLVASMSDLTGIRHARGSTPAVTIEEAPVLAECLPPGLEELEIIQCDEAVLPPVIALLDLAHGSQGFFRNLRYIKLLFIKENVSHQRISENINFYSGTRVRVDYVLQSGPNRVFDKVQFVSAGDEDIENYCTRLYTRDTRQRWLKYRGGNLGVATVDQGVTYCPLL